jgi:putative MATE family efflux protein
MVSTQDRELTSNSDDIIVEGSTWAAIWHMSWPMLVNMLTISLASFADVWIGGKLGSDAQAAIGIGGQVWFLMVLFAVALSSGTTALVSRYWGAREYDQAIEACRQSLLFSVIFGVCSVTLGLLCARPFLHMLGASPAVEKVGWDFLQIDLLSQIPFTTLWVLNAIFRAKGNARVPMFLWGLMTVLIISLDYLLCLGPFHMGVAGIGTAWLIAGTIGVSLGLVILSKSDVADCLNPKLIIEHGLSKKWMLRILNVGLPACIQDLAWVGGNFLLFLIFAKTSNPTACQASWAVGFRAEEMVAGMPIYALSMAVATIVGQNLGAQKPERAERAGWQVATIGGVYNLIVGIVLILLARPIAQHMSTDAAVVDYTTQYFQINGITEPFLAMWLILFGAMQGAGYTKWPMWASSICMTVLRLPVAWYFTINMHWGPAGTWLGMAVATVSVGLLAVWRFKTGVWKYQKI